MLSNLARLLELANYSILTLSASVIQYLPVECLGEFRYKKIKSIIINNVNSKNHW